MLRLACLISSDDFAPLSRRSSACLIVPQIIKTFVLVPFLWLRLDRILYFVCFISFPFYASGSIHLSSQDLIKMGLSTCGTIVGSSGESPEVLCDNGLGKVSGRDESISTAVFTEYV